MPSVPDQVDDVGDGEEVGREAEVLDHGQLVVQPVARRAAPATP